ncbi:hypothetical protein BZG36_02321, partial [Bifiguratus adelaidae]
KTPGAHSIPSINTKATNVNDSLTHTPTSQGSEPHVDILSHSAIRRRAMPISVPDAYMHRLTMTGRTSNIAGSPSRHDSKAIIEEEDEE